MLRFALLLSLTMILAPANVSWGGERWKPQFRRSASASTPSIEVRQRAHYAQAKATGIDLGPYPQFTGGFHAREMQNLGVPAGDVGLRGNGFSMLPW